MLCRASTSDLDFSVKAARAYFTEGFKLPVSKENYLKLGNTATC